MNIGVTHGSLGAPPRGAGGTPHDAERSLRNAERTLRGRGISNARMECEWLIRGALSEHPADINSAMRRFDRMIAERITRKPLAHILGTQPFGDIDITVNSSVLIPRSETELLVKAVADRYSSVKGTLLEIGTGSGCVAVAVSRLCPQLRLTATDISDAALRIARKNAMVSGVAKRIRFVESHVFRNIPRARRFDAIVSNPPYIKTALLSRLQPEVQFEPRLALDGGPDGLDIIRAIAADAPKYLKNNGLLALEIGYDQARRVTALMKKAGFENVRSVKDFQGIERVIMGDWVHG